MPPFRDQRGERSVRGGFVSRGGRGGQGGRDGRGGRGGTAQPSGKLARSGIRTRSGYRKFDSQRTRDVESDSDEIDDMAPEDLVSDDDEELSEDDDAGIELKGQAYKALLQSFVQPLDSHRKHKRRKIEIEVNDEDSNIEELQDDPEEHLGLGQPTDDAAEEDEEALDAENVELNDNTNDEDPTDPFDAHFANPDENELSKRLKAVQEGKWRTERTAGASDFVLHTTRPVCVEESATMMPNLLSPSKLRLKKRLIVPAERNMSSFDSVQQELAPYLTGYRDLLYGGRTPTNAASLRQIACLHALNHVLKGRDRVIKNNERLAKSDGATNLDLRDQGFVRPKVLILNETRQMCYNYASTIVDLFDPEQQENKSRFDSTFGAPLEDERDMPEDYKELFFGNNDNNFMTAIKLTRKTLKFFSAFYTSDIILASPLGLRRVLENADPKKRDHDFLSSIEIVIADQADAMQMQSWENVESIFHHLNLELKEAHGCDFSRVRNYYLDGNSKYLRQSIVFANFVTPEMNRLFNNSMQNVAGRIKFTPSYPIGAISFVSNIGGIKQTFSRFDSPSPASDPDARFKYFTTAILPSLLRLPKPAEGGQGILIFIPSYFDFLRLRNYFATSQQTQNISFGTIFEYSEVSEQRRARSHFVSGRHSFLLYTQRAHHFLRLKLKGVRRVAMYGLPDNAAFYEEIGGLFLETGLKEEKVGEGEAAVRIMFSKWDALALERVVGSARAKGMLGGSGDTFEFV